MSSQTVWCGVWGIVWVWYGTGYGMGHRMGYGMGYGMVLGMVWGMVWGMVCMWYYIVTETPGNCTLTCRENFFCARDNETLDLLCKPLCPEWNLLPSSFVTAYDTFTLVFGPLGIIACIAVLIVSFIRREKV